MKKRRRERFCLVMITCPAGPAVRLIQETLVEEKLAACVSALPGGVRSCYRWQGRVASEKEILLLAKTRRACFPALRKRVGQIHPFEVPEIIALPIEAGSRGYLAWICESTTPAGACP